MNAKTIELTPEQRRDLLRTLLEDAELKAAPVKKSKSKGPLGGLNFEEEWEYDKKARENFRLPIIEIDNDGIATLSNVDSRDLTHILTMASLRCREHRYKRTPLEASEYDPKCKAALDDSMYQHKQSIETKVLCDFLKDAMQYGIAEHNSKFHGLNFPQPSSDYGRRRQNEEAESNNSDSESTAFNDHPTIG